MQSLSGHICDDGHHRALGSPVLGPAFYLPQFLFIVTGEPRRWDEVIFELSAVISSEPNEMPKTSVCGRLVVWSATTGLSSNNLAPMALPKKRRVMKPTTSYMSNQGHTERLDAEKPHSVHLRLDKSFVQRQSMAVYLSETLFRLSPRR